MKGLHHLLRLLSLQRYQQVPKVPALTHPTMFKQVNLPLLPLLVVDGEICSLSTIASPLARNSCIFQLSMIFSPALF
jgi:hypothetical protein